MPNSDPCQITTPLVLVGLGLGVGEGLGLGVELGLGNQVVISRRGGSNLAGVENGHNTGPRHKRTKRLLRAPWPPEGPQVAYMKLQFILFYFILTREMSMDSGNYTKAQY